MLYEMLTGQRAFAGDDITDTIVAVMSKDWESAGGFQIWTVPVEDDGRQLKAGKPEPFLTDPVANRDPDRTMDPSFSPDGRWLAYQSREAGTTDEVFVRAFPAPESGAGGRWQISIGGGAVPRWLPTGDTLLYLANDRIVAVPYSVKGDVFIAGKPRPWSGVRVLPTVFGNLNAGARWDVSADSRRIAVLAPVQSAEPVKPERTVVFLQNFVDELRRRAPLPGR